MFVHTDLRAPPRSPALAVGSRCANVLVRLGGVPKGEPRQQNALAHTQSIPDSQMDTGCASMADKLRIALSLEAQLTQQSSQPRQGFETFRANDLIF